MNLRSDDEADEEENFEFYNEDKLLKQSKKLAAFQRKDYYDVTSASLKYDHCKDLRSKEITKESPQQRMDVGFMMLAAESGAFNIYSKLPFDKLYYAWRRAYEKKGEIVLNKQGVEVILGDEEEDLDLVEDEG